jgi:TetR/AcrR family transcriptional regulator, transcriptional repressor for nem operon
MLEQALGDENSHYDPRGAALRDVAEAVVAQMEGLVLFAKLFNDPARVDKHWAVTARTLGLDAAPVA